MAEKTKYELGDCVVTKYYDDEIFKVVGIRENELELEGDWSGGTHNVMQKSWYPVSQSTRVPNYSLTVDSYVTKWHKDFISYYEIMQMAGHSIDDGDLYSVVWINGDYLGRPLIVVFGDCVPTKDNMIFRVEQIWQK